jgi:hypothetical protein
MFVCVILGNSPASEFYMPTFRNTLFYLHRRIGMKNKDGTECSETSAYKIQKPANYPEESIQQVLLTSHTVRHLDHSTIFTVSVRY